MSETLLPLPGSRLDSGTITNANGTSNEPLLNEAKNDDNDGLKLTSTPSESATEDGRHKEGHDGTEGVSSPQGMPVMDRVLGFFANAETGTLVAVLVGAGAILYVFAGKLGILIIGIVAGIFIRQSFDGGGADTRGKSEWEAIVDRVLNSSRSSSALKINGSINNGDTLDFSSLPPLTAQAMSEFTNALVRDYVSHWYNPIAPLDTSNSFPDACRATLARSFLKAYWHLSSKPAPDMLLMFLITFVNTLIVFFRELGTAMAQRGSAEYSPEAIQSYIEDTPQSALAQLMDHDAQRQKLQQAAEELLQTFVDREILDCAATRAFLTQIISGVVLDKVVSTVASPQFLAEWAIYLLDDETKPEFLAKLDIAQDEVVKEAEVKLDVSKADEVVEQALREAEKVATQSGEKAFEDGEEEMDEAMRKALKEAEEMNRMIEEEETRRRSRQSRDGLAEFLERRTAELPLRAYTPPTARRGNGDTHQNQRRPMNSFAQHYSDEMVHDPADFGWNSYKGEQEPSNNNRRTVPATSFDEILPPFLRKTLNNATTTLNSLANNPPRNLLSRPPSFRQSTQYTSTEYRPQTQASSTPQPYHATRPSMSSTRSSLSRRASEADKRDEEGIKANYIQLEAPTTPNGNSTETLNLPPPPSDMPDDFDLSHTTADVTSKASTSTSSLTKSTTPTLSDAETLFLIDILFSLLTELYSLSPSTSGLRRSLLQIAKSILLKPGSTTVSSTATWISEFIARETSDERIAHLIDKVRMNVCPTEAETAKWNEEAANKDQARTMETAANLVKTKLLPAGIRGVMGERASRECSEVLWEALSGVAGKAVVGAVVGDGVRGICQ